MTWHKVDVRLQCSPRLRRIGLEHGVPEQQRATLLWLAVLAVNAEHDCNGKLGDVYADHGYLATFCPSLNAVEFRAAMQRLLDVGLVAATKSGKPGELELPGWDESWRAVKTSTARVRLHRQLKAEREKRDGNEREGVA